MSSTPTVTVTFNSTDIKNKTDIWTLSKDICNKSDFSNQKTFQNGQNSNNTYVEKLLDRKFSSSIQNVHEAGVILFDQNCQKILIIYEKHSNKWGVPKGSMESNEMLKRNFWGTAKRELYEETGINISCHNYKKHGTIIIKNKLLYLVSSKSIRKYCQPIDTEEIYKIRWISLKYLKQFVEANSCNITIRYINYILNNNL